VIELMEEKMKLKDEKIRILYEEMWKYRAASILMKKGEKKPA